MNGAQVEITFTPDKPGSTKGVLTAKHEDEVLHTDRLDIARDRQREAFLKKLKGRCRNVNIKKVQQLLLGDVDRATQAVIHASPEPPAELDVSRIVRPHLFHVPEVSGLLIPVAQSRGNERPEGKWLLCVQWADGRRECVDLGAYLDLGGGERIWFNPVPSAPLPNTISRWSPRSRAKWLKDRYTPSLDRLFIRVADRFIDFLEFPPEDALGTVYTLALWTLLTYAYPVWPAVPYLSIGGPLGSGKSRLFEVLGLLVYSPIHSSNITAPSLFRTLHSQGGTVLLDEAERLNDRTPEAGEIRSILLAGYQRGGQATRLERIDDDFRPVSFDVYGPKAVAAISSMPAALASRCIRVMMFRAGRGSPVPKRRIDPAAPEWTELRNDLHCMALSHGVQFIAMAGWQPDCAGLNGRDLELWLPILAMAKLIENAGMKGLVDTVEQHALKSIESSQEDIVPEVDEVLLRTLKQMLQDRSWGVTAGDVLEAANVEEPSLLSHYTPRGVAAVFKRYSIKPHRSGGKRYFKPDEKQWKAIEESYGIDFELREPDERTNGNK